MTQAWRASRSWKLVDPELIPFLEAIPLIDFDQDIRLVRADYMRRLPDASHVHAPGVAIEWIQCPGAGGRLVDILLHRPLAIEGSLPAVLHLHSGGHVMGTPLSRVKENAALAAQMQCIVASVAYRLAPENPYPAGLEDAYAALRYLHESDRAQSADPMKIVLLGESAGGGLAVALSALAFARREFRIAHQQLIYPMLDDRTDQHRAGPFCGEFVWTATHNRYAWQALLEDSTTNRSLAVPARAEDYSDLPPTFLVTGALDLFADENLAFARELIRAGISTELHLLPGAFHGFDRAPDARVAIEARRLCNDNLRRVFEDLASARDRS